LPELPGTPFEASNLRFRTAPLVPLEMLTSVTSSPGAVEALRRCSLSRALGGSSTSPTTMGYASTPRTMNQNVPALGVLKQRSF
jgi:hypothetical protein